MAGAERHIPLVRRWAATTALRVQEAHRLLGVDLARRQACGAGVGGGRGVAWPAERGDDVVEAAARGIVGDAELAREPLDVAAAEVALVDGGGAPTAQRWRAAAARCAARRC